MQKGGFHTALFETDSDEGGDVQSSHLVVEDEFYIYDLDRISEQRGN